MAATKNVLTEANISEIIARVADGMSLKQSCAKSKAGYANVVKRIGENEELAKLYAQARACHVYYQVDRMREIAADPNIDVLRGKLMIDCIKWEAARILPKAFGERTQVDVATVGDDRTRQQVTDELLALLAQTGMTLVRDSDVVDVESKRIESKRIEVSNDRE